jgi:hypothetical protein
MRDCLRVQVCFLVNESLRLSDFRIQRVRALSRAKALGLTLLSGLLSIADEVVG